MDSNELFSADNLTNCKSHSKWSPLVIYLLRNGRPQRYTQLKKQIADISQKMLTQTLRQLEDEGIVSRTIYPTVPPAVEYTLTERGKSLLEPFLGIMEQASQRETLESE